MNSVSKDVNNYLIITKSNDYLPDLYKLCLEKVKGGLLVLILASKPFDFADISEQLDMSKSELKRFIVINYTKINDVSKKLMDLHDWTLLPSLVVVDISHMISYELSTASADCMQSAALCAASLLSYLHTVSLQKTKQFQHGKEQNSCVDGFFIVKPEGEQFDETHLKLLKDLYFCKSIVVEDLKV